MILPRHELLILNKGIQDSPINQLWLDFKENYSGINLVASSILLTDINTLLRLPFGLAVHFLELIHNHQIVICAPATYEKNYCLNPAFQGINFLHYPFTLQNLMDHIQPVLVPARNLTPNPYDIKLDSELSTNPVFSSLIGNSPAIKDLRRQIYKAAKTTENVLFVGESGSGKTIAARILHQLSVQKDGPLFWANIASINPDGIESALFGHTRGAFTDALTDRKGYIGSAQNGTLFLDEIGELPSSCQAKLLRALEERRYRPVGSDKEKTTNARFIFATNSDLYSMMQRHLFREDLYYRISQIVIEVPSLSKHMDDIELLAKYFISKQCQKGRTQEKELSMPALEKLKNFSWPGNIRHLENVIRRACIMSSNQQIQAEDIDLR